VRRPEDAELRRLARDGSRSRRELLAILEAALRVTR
jgi:hypothetical protein